LVGWREGLRRDTKTDCPVTPSPTFHFHVRLSAMTWLTSIFGTGLYANNSDMLVIWRVKITWTHYSTVPFSNFCIHSYSTQNVNLIKVLPPGCTMLYYMFNTQMFLRSRRVPHSEHSLNLYSWSAASSVSNAYLTANKVSLNLHSWSAASSISTRTSQRTQCLSTYILDQLLLRSQRVPHSEKQCLSTYTLDQLLLRSQRVPPSEQTVSQPTILSSCFFHLKAYLTAHIVFLQPVPTVNFFFGLNAYLTAHTTWTYSATMTTRMASLLSMAIGVTHPLTQAPTQSHKQDNYDYMTGVSACHSLCRCILWT